MSVSAFNFTAFKETNRRLFEKSPLPLKNYWQNLEKSVVQSTMFQNISNGCSTLFVRVKRHSRCACEFSHSKFISFSHVWFFFIHATKISSLSVPPSLILQCLYKAQYKEIIYSSAFSIHRKLRQRFMKQTLQQRTLQLNLTRAEWRVEALPWMAEL